MPAGLGSMAKEAKISLWAENKSVPCSQEAFTSTCRARFILSYTVQGLRAHTQESGGKWAMEVLPLYPFPQTPGKHSAREIF